MTGFSTDRELALRCSQGDEAAWDEFGRRYFAFIHSVAGRFLAGSGGADLADQVIADLWQRGKIGRFEGRSTLRTWLAAVVAHAALNARKSIHRQVPLEEGMEATGAGSREDPGPISRSDERGRLQGLLRDALAALTPDERLLLRLHYEQSMTLDQISPILRLSKAGLSRRVKRVRERLLDSMERLSKERMGVPLASARGGLELDQWEFDLEDFLSEAQQTTERTV